MLIVDIIVYWVTKYFFTFKCLNDAFDAFFRLDCEYYS